MDTASMPGTEDVEYDVEDAGIADSQQYGAIITPQFAFGCTGVGRGAISFLEGDKLMFPAGVHAATYRLSNEEMRLTPLTEGVKCARAVALSPNRKYFAVIEETAVPTPAAESDNDGSRTARSTNTAILSSTPSHQQHLNHHGASHQQYVWAASVYSTATGKRVKSFTPEPCSADSATTITSLSFSGSSKLLAVQCSGADNTLLIYRWYMGKLLLTVSHESPVIESVFSPVDENVLSSVGCDLATLSRLDFEAGSARVLPIANADPSSSEEFTSMAWLVGNLIAITTTRGHIKITQDMEMKAVLLPDADDSLHCVTAKGRGMIAGGRKGIVYFYEPTGIASKKSAAGHDMFHVVRTLDAHVAGRGIMELAMSPAEDSLCCLTSARELLHANLPAIQEREDKALETVLGRGWDLTGDAEHEPFRLIGGGLGGSKIVGLDASSQQPLMAVLTANKMLRVINYHSRRPLVTRQLLDDVLCAALHPSGTMLLVGMHDKLALYSIALDELQDLASFSVKKCHVVKYSPGGSKFAAVGRSNVIVIHHAYRHTQLAVLKGHVSAVTDMAFSSDERLLCSTGAGGAVYFWDIASGSRLSDSEYVDKRCIYACVAIAGNSNGPNRGMPSAVVRAMDGRVQHLQNGRVEFELCGPQGGEASCMQLLGGDRVLLAADLHGGLVSYPWPERFPQPVGADRHLPGHHTRVHATGAPISHMIAFPEHGVLITASSDGVVMVSCLSLVLGGTLIEGNSAGLLMGAGTSSTVSNVLPDTVPVPIERLSASASKLVEMAGMLATVRSDAEYAAFRTAQALREALSRAEAELVQLKATLQAREAELAMEREAAGSKEQAIVKSLEGAHLAAVEELESLYDAKLQLEAGKQSTAAAAADDRFFRLQEQMRRLQASHAAEVAALNEKHARALQASADALARERAAMGEQTSFWEEYAVQAEVDYDEAEARLNAKLASTTEAAEGREGLLRAELNLLKRASLRLKGEKALDAKRLDKLLRDNGKLQDSLDESNDTINKLKRELSERESVLADNFFTLQELRHKIQDLEKHKYVLAYKAESYQSELEPRKAEVRELKHEIEMQQAEMVERLATSSAQTRTLAEKEACIKSLKSELASTKLRVAHQDSLLRMFSHDLAEVYNASDEKTIPGKKSARQQGLEDLYSKYAISGTAHLKSNMQVEQELTRHLHMSELRTALVQHRLKEEKTQASSDRRHTVKQNVTLLRELQVALQDNREVSRTLAATRSSLRELGTKQSMLEERLRAISLTGLDQHAITQGQSATPKDMDHGAGQAASATSQEWGLQLSLTQPQSPRKAIKGTQRPASAGPTAAYRYRTAGGPPGHGSLLRGSASRALHELVAVERDRISFLLDELSRSAQHVERQQSALSALHSALQAALAVSTPATQQTPASHQQGATSEPADDTDPEGPSGSQQLSKRDATDILSGVHQASEEAHTMQRLSWADDAVLLNAVSGNKPTRARPSSAMPHTCGAHRGQSLMKGLGYRKQNNEHVEMATAAQTAAMASSLGRDNVLSGYAKLLSSNDALSAQAKRRPTSAAGVGLRAYLNTGLKAWRDGNT